MNAPLERSPDEPSNEDGSAAGLPGATQKIDDRRRTELRLAEQARLLDLSFDAIFVRDAENRITYWSKGAESAYGFSREEALGRDPHKLLRTEFPEPFERIHEALLRDGRWVGELIHTRKDGARVVDSTRWALDRDSEGRPSSILETNTDITERKRAEESRFRLAAIVESSEDAIVSKDLNGVITTWNAGAERLFGYTAQESIGQPVTMLIPADHLDEEPFVLSRIRRGERVERYETVRRRKDGTLIDVSLSVSPIVDAHGHIIGESKIVRDITARKKAEATLRRNEALFSTLVEQAPTGVYVVDSQFRLQQVNALALPAFENVNQHIGRDFSEVMHILWGPDVGGEIVRIFRHTLETGEAFVSPRFTEFRRDLDEERSYEWQIQRITLPDGENGIVCYFQDVTEQVSSERALRDAKAAAEAANSSKDRFLAILSHELRTPLTPVLMTAAALEHDPDLRRDVREDLAMIRRNIELETKLIDDLLDLNRIISGKLQLSLEAVDLKESVSQVCDICRSQINERHIRLEIELDPAVSHVTADPARFQQVLWNVLKNAIKFTPENGTIRISAKLLSKGPCEVRVSDSGVGIPADVLPRIFNAFEQGNARVTREFGGLGLGLAISKALMELHRGSIRAESSGTGQGSTFIIEIPVAETPRADPLDTLPSQDGKPRQLRLLLVEDHADTSRTLARLLRNAGFSVVTASDLASATATVEHEPIDLLISDLGLPDGSGYELMNALRTKRSVPGIAMSGYGMEEDVRRSRDAGFTEHLVKPINLEDLLSAIRRVAGNRALAANVKQS